MKDESLLNSKYFSERQIEVSSLNLPDDGATYSLSKFELKIYQELSITQNINEFSVRIEKYLSDLGFNEYSFTRLSVTDDIPSPLITMPKEMSDIYFHEAFFEHDLMLQYAMGDNGPIFYSVLEKYVNSAPVMTDSIRQNMEIFRLLKTFGYEDFYFIPIGAFNGNGRVMLAIASRHGHPANFHKRIEKTKAILYKLAQAIEYFGIRKFPDFFLGKDESRDIVIHPRPLKLLNSLAKDGLTLEQTADKLCISIHTANHQIAAAKKALDATTIAGAVYAALKSGLIDTD